MRVSAGGGAVLTVGVMRCSSPSVTLLYMLLTSRRMSSYSETVICVAHGSHSGQGLPLAHPQVPQLQGDGGAAPAPLLL